MKYKFFSLLLILILSFPCVSFADTPSDSFNFDDFAGSDTLNAVPAKGSIGYWQIIERNSSSDGINGIKGEDGALKLISTDSQARYVGITYRFNNPVTTVAEYNMKLKFTGDNESIGHTLMLRADPNAGNAEILDFRDGYIRLFGKKLYSGDTALSIDNGKWCDINLKYDVTSAFWEVRVTVDSVTVTECGIASDSFKDKLPNVKTFVLMTKRGSAVADGIKVYAYIDDFTASIPGRIHKYEPTDNFEDFVSSPSGTKAPDGYTLSCYRAYINDSTPYAGIFALDYAEGRAMELRQNAPGTLELSKDFTIPISGWSEIGFSLNISDYSSQRIISLTDNDGNPVELMRTDTSGNIITDRLFGASLAPGKWYDIKYITSDTEAYIEIYSGTKLLHRLKAPYMQSGMIDKINFKTDNSNAESGISRTLLDNIYIKEISDVTDNAMYISAPMIFTSSDGITSRLDTLRQGLIMALIKFR